MICSINISGHWLITKCTSDASANQWAVHSRSAPNNSISQWIIQKHPTVILTSHFHFFFFFYNSQIPRPRPHTHYVASFRVRIWKSVSNDTLNVKSSVHLSPVWLTVNTWKVTYHPLRWGAVSGVPPFCPPVPEEWSHAYLITTF